MNARLVSLCAAVSVMLFSGGASASVDIPADEDDLQLEVRPDKLGIKEVLKKGSYFGAKTAAVAGWSAEPGLRALAEHVRDKALWELEGEFIISDRKSIKEDEDNPWAAPEDAEDAAKAKGASLLFVTEVIRADGRPTVRLHLFKVGGDKVGERDCDKCLMIHRWTEYQAAMRKEMALAGAVTGYSVRKSALPLDALMGAARDRPKGKVALMVLADSPELTAGVSPLAQVLDERLRKTTGVESVIAPQSADSIAGKSDQELVGIGAASGVVATVVARLAPVTGTELVRVTLRRLDATGRAVATAASVALVVASHGSRDLKALTEFKRRAVKSELKGEITETYRSSKYGTVKTGDFRNDVMVLQDAQGAELDEADTLALHLTAADREKYQTMNTWGRVKTFSRIPYYGGWALMPLCGGLGCLAGAGVGAVFAVAASSPVFLLAGVIVGALVGFCPVGGLAAAVVTLVGVGAGLVSSLAMPAVPNDHVPVVARFHNLELAKELGVDPVDVDPEYFPEPADADADGEG